MSSVMSSASRMMTSSEHSVPLRFVPEFDLSHRCNDGGAASENPYAVGLLRQVTPLILRGVTLAGRTC